MVKLVLEISKKIFPTASTLILQVLLNETGTLISSEPSLGVAAAKTTGKLFPPSVDNKMFTLAQFTGAPVVPFTLQVTVAVLPASQVILVLGDVTWNGPELFVTVTTISVNAVCPTDASGINGLLSRTVNLKFKVRATELKASIFVPGSPPGNGPVTNDPARIVDNVGKVLVGEAVGLKDNQFGPVVLVGDATLAVPDVVELSFCSQQ